MYDNSLVTINDYHSNFFVKNEDIQSNTRADIAQRGLMEINYSALVMIYKGELSENFSILNEYNIVIITEIIDIETAESLNQYCRKKNIGFIYASEFGLASFLFTDFGDDFNVEDLNGKENEKYFIKSISNSCPGIVEIEPIKIIKNDKKTKKFLKLGTGDFVSFKDITGMTELNDTPPRPIRVLSKTKFTIEDTSKFQEFTGSGMVEEVKVSNPINFKPISEAKDFIYNEDDIEDDLDEEFNSDDENSFNNGSNDNSSWIKMFYSQNQNDSFNNIANEKIHLAVLALHEFFSIHQFLPHCNEQNDIDECIDISSKILAKAKEEKKKWVNNLKNIDKIFLEKIFKFSRFYFTPMTCFFGGIVSQEILKYIGLYKPSNQWTYFNFLDLLNEETLQKNFKNKVLDDDYKKNIEPYTLFGKEKINEIKNINILIIGLNNTGYEILKILIMLDLITDNENILILGNNKDEIEEKINDLKCNDKNNKIKIINEEININGDLSEKDWWKKSIIIIDTLPFQINHQEKIYIINKCKKDNKILIDINTNKSIGSYELVLPSQLINYNKKNINSLINEDDITPEGPRQNDNLNIINTNESKNKKYKNIYSFEESLNWSKNFFETNFNTNIKHLNVLINKSGSEKEMKKYLDELINNENDNLKSLKLILTFKKLISLKLGMTFESLVFHSIEKFQELFEFSIDEILGKYPSDLIVHETNKKFWSGKRLEPKKIKFDCNNEEHYQFIYYLTYFYCQVLRVEDIEEKMKTVKDIALKYELKKYDITITKKANNMDFFNIEKDTLIKFLGDIMKINEINKVNLQEIEINYTKNHEKVEDLDNINEQLKLIVLASNIKLSNYELNKKNIYNELSILLKINNSLPAVSSAISGLVVLQLFNMFNDLDFMDYVKSVKDGKLKNENNNNINNNDENSNKINIINDDNISNYKNAIFNLANNVYLLYDS